VYLNLMETVYNNTTAQYTISGDYANYVPGQLVVIRSLSQNPDNLSIGFAGTGTANNFVFSFDNTRGWSLQDLTLLPKGTTYRSAVEIKGGSSHIWIDNCKLIGDSVILTGTTSLGAN